jgi:hypothetical protein
VIAASLRTAADTSYIIDPYFEYHAVDVDATRDKKTGAYGGLFGRKNKTKTKTMKERRRSSVGVIAGDLSNVSLSNDGPSAVKASKFCDSDDEEFNLNSDGDGDADLDLGTTHCSIILTLVYFMINGSLSCLSCLSCILLYLYRSIGVIQSYRIGGSHEDVLYPIDGASERRERLIR